MEIVEAFRKAFGVPESRDGSGVIGCLVKVAANLFEDARAFPPGHAKLTLERCQELRPIVVAAHAVAPIPDSTALATRLHSRTW